MALLELPLSVSWPEPIPSASCHMLHTALCCRSRCKLLLQPCHAQPIAMPDVAVRRSSPLPVTKSSRGLRRCRHCRCGHLPTTRVSFLGLCVNTTKHCAIHIQADGGTVRFS